MVDSVQNRNKLVIFNLIFQENRMLAISLKLLTLLAIFTQI